jgi:enoyl-CoA hydratase
VIEVAEFDGVAVVTLAHGKVNALDIELCRAITQTFRELDGGPHRGVVFTGAGSAFSAGVDLWRVIEGGGDYVDAFIPALVEAFEAVFTCGVPVVAAINGHAIAGGCVLAACCDFRVMTTGKGGIGIPELLVGVPFPATALAIVEHAAGVRPARRLAYSGALLTGAQALEQGLADALAEPGALAGEAVSQAARLATTIAPDTFRATKRHLNRLPEPSPYDGEVVRLWRERVADGWIAGYLARTIRK